MNTIDSDDFTADDIVELIPSMSNGLIKNYREFESRIANSETNCRKYHSIIKGYINFIGNFPSVLRNNVDQLELNLIRNKGILKEKKAEVEDLLKIEKELVESEHKNEQKIESLREKISHSREKINHLEDKRDKILAYKLLTNTSFCYDGPNISGYVADPKSKNIKCFNLDPEKLSQQAITENLYEIIKEVSLETSELENVKMNQKECEENS